MKREVPTICTSIKKSVITKLSISSISRDLMHTYVVMIVTTNYGSGWGEYMEVPGQGAYTYLILKKRNIIGL